jgi:hypothetical protein
MCKKLTYLGMGPTTFCSSLPLLSLSPVGDVASAVENALAAYSYYSRAACIF